jgi:hypothetical protein
MIGPNTPQREADVILFPPHYNGRPLIQTKTKTTQCTGRSTVDAQGVLRPNTPARVTRPAKPAKTLWEQVKPWLMALAVLTATAAAVAIVWLIYMAVMAVIAFVTAVVTWITAHLLLIGVILTALFFFGTSGAACAGIHCGGCRR